MTEDLDAQWQDALAALTELALRRVTVVAMPPPDAGGRVSAGHGGMVTLTGVLGRMIEPEGRGRDVLQFPVGEPEGSRAVGGFGISRPAFRGAARAESGSRGGELGGLPLMIRPVPDAEDATAAPGEPV